MKTHYSLIVIFISILISCSGKDKKEEIVDIRQYESNRIYKLIIKQFDVFKVTDMKVDTKLYKYEIDKSEIDYLGEKSTIKI